MIDEVTAGSARAGAPAQLSWVGTALHVLVTAAVLVGGDDAEVVYVWATGALFFGGLAAMLVAFGRAVERSRTEAIGMGGLYLLADSAPATVARSFRATLAIQSIVGLAGAIARPYTALAFGLLVPVWALGLAGCWGAWYGTFEARQNAARP